MPDIQARSVNKVNIPDGSYKGFWGGWNVSIYFNDDDFYLFKVDAGIKTLKLPVSIQIQDGIASICS
jgi:hypothetical protein